MIPEFTAEEKAFIYSVQTVVTDEEPIRLERIPCIRAIAHLMFRTGYADVRRVMDHAQNKLGLMNDAEYESYGFSVDDVSEVPEDASDTERG
jgi:hypothetical protein